jgi:G3E family GTPase
VALPFTVIGGYLGAGKTTLVNRLLAHAHGRRLVVLVNDFGDIAVDAALIEADDGDTISFANGCVCCSLADGFAVALARLRERSDRFDHVVVEVSGVGNPRGVAQWGRTPGFELDGVLVLADATEIQRQLADPYVGETVAAQLAAADLVVLTKLDLSDPPAAARARATIAGHTDAPVVSGPIGFDAVVSVADPAAVLTPGEDAPHATHETRTIAADRPIARAALDAFLADRPDGVVRVKGLVRLVGGDDPVVVQVVGRRVEITARSVGGSDARAALVAVAVPGTPTDRLDAWVEAFEASDPAEA